MNSMTGIGRAQGAVVGIPVRLEIKSVNHRYCDVTFKAPFKYALLEINVAQTVKKQISRGRIDIFLFEEKVAQMTPAQATGYQAYRDFLTQLKTELNLSDPITLDLVLSGAHQWMSTENDHKALWTEFEPILMQALDDLRIMRSIEGNKLKDYIKKDFATIGKLKNGIADQICSVQKEIEVKIKERISERAKEIKELDPQRLHTEVVYYLDRMDITEELVRLDSHLSQIKTLLESQEPIGRKLDFMLQEFGREFNTIGSKCSLVQISHLVVEAKATLEKIREQAMNVE
jgi:uncharacterized protein (TIGR00255 family)